MVNCCPQAPNTIAILLDTMGQQWANGCPIVSNCFQLFPIVCPIVSNTIGNNWKQLAGHVTGYNHVIITGYNHDRPDLHTYWVCVCVGSDGPSNLELPCGFGPAPKVTLKENSAESWWTLTHSANSPPERVFSILNNTFEADQDNSRADYIELSPQLQFNHRSRSNADAL